MTTKSIYQKPVAVVFDTYCDEVLCSSRIGSGVDDVSVSEGWDWDDEDK